MRFMPRSDEALCEHDLGDLAERRDVRAGDEVVRICVFLRVLLRAFVDVLHDALEFRVDLLERPLQALGILCHLEGRDGDAAGVRGLGWRKEDLVLLEVGDGIERGRHVRALADGLDSVRDERLRAVEVDLALRRARQCDVALDRPDALAALVVLRLGMRLDIFLDAAAAHLLDFLDGVEVDTVRIVDVAIRVGAGYDLRAEALRLLDGVLGDVARAGDDERLALEVDALRIEHVLDEIEQAVARRLRACERTPVVDALAREDARVIAVADALVLAEEIADLTAADADIARRHIDVRADVAVELRHEALAEMHDLVVRLAVRIEVRTALRAADGQARERVLEHLLEREEFQNVEVDARMEAQAALVGADCAAHLHAETAVHLDFTLVILCLHYSVANSSIRSHCMVGNQPIGCGKLVFYSK